MDNLFILFLFVLNTIFIGKYFTSALTKWEMFSIRKFICIERLCREQKCGDAIIAVYNSIICFSSIWVSIILLGCATKLQISLAVLTSITLTIVSLLLLFFLVQYILTKTFFLDKLYHEIIDYKRKEEVITEDNDYEVRYIQTYREIEKERWYCILWAIYILFTSYYYYSLYI